MLLSASEFLRTRDSGFHTFSSSEEAATIRREMFPSGATSPPSRRSLNSRVLPPPARLSLQIAISGLQEGTFQETSNRSKDLSELLRVIDYTATALTYPYRRNS